MADNIPNMPSGAEEPSPTNDPLRPLEHIGFTVPFNMSEQPAASINCGYARNGLPSTVAQISTYTPTGSIHRSTWREFFWLKCRTLTGWARPALWEEKCPLIFSARSSSMALEWERLSLIPIVGKKSMIVFAFTSSSLASSLMRIKTLYLPDSAHRQTLFAICSLSHR